MPSSMENASTVGMPNESGISSATPIAAVNPGNAPKTIPNAVPVKHAARDGKVNACCKP